MLAKEDGQITPCQAFTNNLIDMVNSLLQEDIDILIAGHFDTHNDISGILKKSQEECNFFMLNDPTGMVG
jgi:hypothetical protein